ncbi:MAG: NAD(P)-dependent oxidoreductase [Siculibacillus sp.]|nr:NAD(P)-dependent oxidoreductase [Siculibacillus sp.]
MGGRIGFLGTGIMGFHMARRLAEAGHAVIAWNRSRDKAERLAPFGVAVADTAAEAARDAAALVVMLSSGPVCEQVLVADGVLDALPLGARVVVMSSIPVATAERLAAEAEARGLAFLDAPVSGGERGAAAGTLTVMAGGRPEVFAAAAPIFAVFGRATLIGPAGTGELAKLVNQMLVGSTIAAVAEGLVLAERGGADPAKVREALLGGFADSTILRQHGERMVTNDWKPGAMSTVQLKDTSTALAQAAALGLDLPLIALVDGLYADLVAHGDGALDHAALVREIRRRNRLPLDRPASS